MQRIEPGALNILGKQDKGSATVLHPQAGCPWSVLACSHPKPGLHFMSSSSRVPQDAPQSQFPINGSVWHQSHFGGFLKVNIPQARKHERQQVLLTSIFNFANYKLFKKLWIMGCRWEQFHKCCAGHISVLGYFVICCFVEYVLPIPHLWSDPLPISGSSEYAF